MSAELHLEQYRHIAELDRVIDSLGFGEVPQPRRYADSIELAQRAIVALAPGLENDRLLLEWFYSQTESLIKTHMSEGAINANILGSVAGNVIFSNGNLLQETDEFNLMKRTVQDVRIAREVYGYGDEEELLKGFHDTRLRFKQEKLPAGTHQYLDFMQYEVARSKRMKPLRQPWMQRIVRIVQSP